jgi:hypothetical protein
VGSEGSARLARLGCWPTAGGLFRRTYGSMLADGRFPGHIRDMAIPCPKCTVCAAIGIEGEFVFLGGRCIELSGTLYINRFEWCQSYLRP